jgi:hypothetical protein
MAPFVHPLTGIKAVSIGRANTQELNSSQSGLVSYCSFCYHKSYDNEYWLSHVMCWSLWSFYIGSLGQTIIPGLTYSLSNPGRHIGQLGLHQVCQLGFDIGQLARFTSHQRPGCSPCT